MVEVEHGLLKYLGNTIVTKKLASELEAGFFVTSLWLACQTSPVFAHIQLETRFISAFHNVVMQIKFGSSLNKLYS